MKFKTGKGKQRTQREEGISNKVMTLNDYRFTLEKYTIRTRKH